MPDTSVPRRRARVLLLLGVGTAGLMIGVAAGFLASAAMRGELTFYDEWVCSRDEAPATTSDGGYFCAPLTASLPAGATWDPLGNRPYDCSGRDGWVVIERRQSGEIECFRDYTPLPPGWQLVS
ncbi:hypothetical protein [Nocardioides sp. R-C-SC26]|uniref:hypothetical protein n=1 Tax=Nocardioides sp. R-C-SC26 TaxID=2870414 RepID=UPI001E5F2BB5|nr:hypothetical protein [Nocardioides sp. R-C-SC26]